MSTINIGQPKRHLLTSGWSTFVTSKKLFAGDACVFVRFSFSLHSLSFEGVFMCPRQFVLLLRAFEYGHKSCGKCIKKVD